MKRTLAIITTHPIQYQVPLFKEINKIKKWFPLHINNENNKKLINKIIEISKDIYVNFINAIFYLYFKLFIYSTTGH